MRGHVLMIRDGEKSAKERQQAEDQLRADKGTCGGNQKCRGGEGGGRFWRILDSPGALEGGLTWGVAIPNTVGGRTDHNSHRAC